MPNIGIMDAALAFESRGDIIYKNKGNMTREEIDKMINPLIALKKQSQFRATWTTFERSVELILAGEVEIQSVVAGGNALFPHLSVRDNVAFSLRVRGTSRRERYREADRMIEQVQLTELAARPTTTVVRRPAATCGARRAIITRPRVLLLDEPLSALDEFLRLQMRAELKEMQQRLGITSIHVTHTQLEAVAVADQVVVMAQGRIVQCGQCARDLR